ncbi:MAG: hypothetical protein Ct9H300mP9_0550 [Candidatus Neomarinimicrobiota bacterium]|nr:MAG: hypothetical protein Ct9H300mP9_0550 [Candidatus Neomarinimicrobiota bacterium]
MMYSQMHFTIMISCKDHRDTIALSPPLIVEKEQIDFNY